ncbi:MAG: hypothetical protein KF774_21580, partial [Planctomyces sp.]|nr:hypothetical protein [Planctomyces sp.]
MRWTALTLLAICVPGLARAEEPPRSLVPGLNVSLFAEQPLIRTPTGIDVDARGRVWAIECNTHFRPSGYAGHPSDRVLVFSDADGDGRAEEPTMFADGFAATMSVAVRPHWLPPVQVADGPAAMQQAYVATRAEVWLLEDLDGDDVCDRRTALFRLDTRG